MTRKAYAKVNIFLKIAGKRDNYHEIVSRFVRVKNLYDTVTLEKGKFNEFIIEGNFGCETKKNTIYKAYLKLSVISPKVEELFMSYKVTVDKHIPEFAGLGGGSSNCATFMLMVNEICNLGLSKDELSEIAITIGADVPFFIYEYDSANISGIGEIVKYFKEEPLDIQTFTPNIKCDTGLIFQSFRDVHYKEISIEDSTKLLEMKSKDIYNSMSRKEANDLYQPALDIYNVLIPQNYNLPPNCYFSGSGSSFFYIT
ncbi:MAG: 4-diphosphocytidyl-2-C-methyl-D-erythritol kinase [Arcobacteraceae bacterium]|jgi:4-diphosphocytidyl-2-C-methyl-D-erythritol kinase